MPDGLYVYVVDTTNPYEATPVYEVDPEVVGYYGGIPVLPIDPEVLGYQAGLPVLLLPSFDAGALPVYSLGDALGEPVVAGASYYYLGF